MRVLLAEDEKKVASFISKALRESGYSVDEVGNGNDALAHGCANAYDTIVLDIMMPGRDGLSVLKLLRERQIGTPVLILTARGEVSERVEGLELGADDYLGKPFAMRELLARVGALTRRASPERNALLQVADLTVNLLTRVVQRAGQTVHLPVREFSLLEYLIRSPGRVHTRTSLCEHVWGYRFDTSTNVVDVYIQRLRKKIDEGHDLKLLRTVRGVGYVLKEDGGP
jgi:DNA-binding response OmpR family regulator